MKIKSSSVKLTTFVGAMLALVGIHASAQTALNIDIQGDHASDGTANQYWGTIGTVSGQAGALAAGGTWNGVPVGWSGYNSYNSGGYASLVDDVGSATSINYWSSIANNGGGGWCYTPGAGSASDWLMQDYGFTANGTHNLSLFSSAAANTGLTLTAGSLWNIYIYSQGNGSSQGGSFTLKQDAGDVTLTADGLQWGGPTWSGNFVQGSDYVAFLNVTPTAFSSGYLAPGYEFSITMAGAINGIQIQAVPEPSTMAFIGVGLFGLVAVRRFIKPTSL